MLKAILIFIMVIHGLIHLMGGLTELDIMEIDDLSGETKISISDQNREYLGYIWMLTVFLFLISAFGFYSDTGWWKFLASIAVIISQALIIIWWPDAKYGTIANAIIFLGLFYE